MPVTVPALRAGGVLVPQSMPADRVRTTLRGASYVFDTTDDFYAADLAPAIGTNVLSAPLAVHPRFAGMHYHARLPTVRYAVARNVDLPGCMWWSVASAGRGAYDWGAMDAFVAQAAAGGRDVIVDLAGTPAWASARPAEPGHYGPGSDAEPADARDLADFAAAACARYRALGTPIAAFEVWNEPKYAGGGGVAAGNYFTGTPQALAAMARAAYRAVKAVDPGVLVLSPAPTGLEYPWLAGDGSGTDNLDRFLAADDGSGGAGRDWVDAIAFHAYSHDGTNNVFAIPQMVANVRACMALHGLADRAIWITETSAITPPLDSFVARHQQDYIARTLLLALGCGVERVVWYAWDDALGFADQPDVARRWDALVEALSGATVTLVNALANGQVAAIVGGARHLA
jgi:hypothetical protein